MAARHEGYFVGAMPPERFLEHFMTSAEVWSPAPCMDLAGIHIQPAVPDMCTTLLQAIDKAKICPSLRLFRTRTKKQWLNETKYSSHPPSFSDIQDNPADRCNFGTQYGRWPALAARMRPRPRQGTKKKINIVEAYNYSTVLLDIEVQRRREADPFTDPQDEETPALFHEDEERSAAPSPGRYLAACSLQVPLPNRRTPYRPEGPFISRAAPPTATPSPDASQLSLHIKLEPERSPMRLKPMSPFPGDEFYPLFESPAPESASFRSSLVAHAAEHFTRQHRMFFFQVVIFDRWARFLRWDRSGAISTERFDYVTRPEVLSEFFWRFDHMTDEQRGLDPTATVATLRERRLYRNTIHEFLGDIARGYKAGVVQRPAPGVGALLEDAHSWPVWKLHVVDATTRKSTDLLVGRPLFDEVRVFGRATRAYIAHDLKAECLVFLKDTWRIDHPSLSVESKTYRTLKRYDVPHIQDIMYGGDVRDTYGRIQETLAQNYAEADDEWRITNSPLKGYVHHRLVQDIAYPLQSALDVKEVIQVMRDILLAIQKAYEAARLLHRDLSIGNVMVDSNGRGVLNDWDCAGSRDEAAPGVGTWRFMSIPMLSEHGKIHDIADDLESFYWVFLFGAMHRFARPDQAIPLDVFDYQVVDKHGRATGGNAKVAWLRDPNGLLDVGLSSESPELEELLLDSQNCWLRYHLARKTFRGDAEPSDDPRNKSSDILGQAADPAFWLSKFEATLQALADKGSEPCTPPTSRSRGSASPEPPVSISGPGPNSADQQAGNREESQYSSLSSTSSAGRKRRVEELDPDLAAPFASDGRKLRRSSRLKA